MTRLLGPLLLFVLAAPLFAADPETTVRALLTHYVAGDLPRAGALWLEGTPRNDFLAGHRRRINVRCARLLSLETRIASRDDERAAVETEETFLVAGTRPEQTHSRFLLHRHGGEWKIASWESREAVLAGRITAAGPAERADILAESPELHTAALARLLSRRAIVRVNENQLADAASLTDLASALAERLGDPAALAEAMSARSVLTRYGGRADPERAFELAREAAALAARSGDPDAVAGTLLRYARANEFMTGSLDADPLRAILAEADRVEDAAMLSLIATYVARSLNARGAVREGVRYAELAWQYAEKSGDAAARISASLVLGGAYTTYTDDNELGLRYYRNAATMATEAGFDSAAAFSFLSIANVHWGSGDGESAKRTVEEALRKIKAPSGLAGLLIKRAHMHAAEENDAAAERDLQRALELFPSDATTRFNADVVRAGIHHRRGRHEEVLAIAARANAALNHDFRALRMLEVSSLRRLGRNREALQIIERLAAEAQPLNTAIADPDRLLFTSVPYAFDGHWMTLLVEEGKLAQALNVSERAKFATILRASVAEGERGDHELADPDARRAEQTLAARVAALNRALVAAPGAAEAAAVREQLANARADLIDFRQRAFAKAPAAPVQLATEIDLDALPSRLDAVTIVSYVPLEESTFLFVIGPKQRGPRTLSVRTAAIGEKALSSLVARLAVLLNERNLRADAAGTELYELLLKPIEPEIAAAAMLCIVPARDLWRVPFHALRPADGVPLVERTPVFYAPSIGVLVAAESKRQQRRSGDRPAVLAFANPHVNAETASLYRAFDRAAPLGALPETETEVRAIGRIYGAHRSSIRIGAEARETILKRDAPRYDVLHVATHGLVHDRAPMFSALLLAASPDEDGDDGLLEVREIARMQLGADLAVFSACDTGKLSSGVLGFSWALLAAGCPTTVVSQWNAQSAATAKLMIEFHRRLVGGASKPEALRRAQLHVRADRRYRHLFYWAPFVIVGAP